jgi:hypothetical protein
MSVKFLGSSGAWIRGQLIDSITDEELLGLGNSAEIFKGIT